MTYSLTRFAIYETVRDQLTKGSQWPLSFSSKVLLGGVSGERPSGEPGWQGRMPPGVTCVAPWLCCPRFNRRLCGDPRGFGQCQVRVCPRPLRSGTFLSPDSPGLALVACWGL